MTLANTAAALRRNADKQPGRIFPHQLERGLKLTIRRDGEQLTVEAARMGVPCRADAPARRGGDWVAGEFVY